MNKEKYLKELDKRAYDRYKACLHDCQIPTGALADLEYKDFYVLSLEMRLNIVDAYGILIKPKKTDKRK